jgi:hypothetical protein
MSDRAAADVQRLGGVDEVRIPVARRQRGEHQLPADELVVGQLGAVLADHHAENVLARLAPRPLDQRAHVCAALPLQLHSVGNRNGQIQLAGAAPLEVLAVVVRHPEQLADHQRRNGQREAVHQIRWRPGGFHRVELLIDDFGDAWFQPLHPADGELRGEHAA